jgi:hypothetical protein
VSQRAFKSMVCQAPTFHQNDAKLSTTIYQHKTFSFLRKHSLESRDIQEIAKIHQKLTDVIRIINQIYSVFVMMFFGGVFCIFNLFLFSLVTIGSYIVDPREAFMSLVVNVGWNFYDWMIIFVVIHSATAASGEGRKTTKFIYKLVNESVDAEINGRVMEIGFAWLHLKSFSSFFPPCLFS